MVMNSDKVSLKSFDVKKINIESVVINTMVGTYSLNVSYSIYKLYYDIDFSNRPFHYTCLLFVEHALLYKVFPPLFFSRIITKTIESIKIIPFEFFAIEGLRLVPSSLASTRMVRYGSIQSERRTGSVYHGRNE